jgi:predicted  nucleic acid-binding Zn-ribbon protein
VADQNTHIRGAAMAFDETSTDQETPFDRLEERIDALIERYEKLLGEHNRCGEELEAKEARIRELEAQLEKSEQRTLQIRTRLDALIDKLSRFS